MVAPAVPPVLVLTGMALEARIAAPGGPFLRSAGSSLPLGSSVRADSGGSGDSQRSASRESAAAGGDSGGLESLGRRASSGGRGGGDAGGEAGKGGALGSAPVEVLFGLRGEALAAALSERLRHPCAGLISFGMAGGLAPGLPAGTVIIAHGIVTPTGTLHTDPTWTAALHAALQAALPAAQAGAIAGVDTPLATAEEKAALHQASGALAVDMESHIGARLARHAGIPFAACRVITDPAGTSVPTAALAGFGEDGSVALAPLLRELLRRPGQLPALLRLGSDAAKARGALRQVREELGERFGR